MAGDTRPDYWAKASAGAILGLGLALSLVGPYAYLGPGGINAPGGRYSLMRYLEVFVWIAVFGFCFLFRSGRPAWMWLTVTLKDPQYGDLTEVSDINVTPFIDVILVLLIIFMVAALLSTIDVAVDLPVSNAQQQPRPDKPVFLTVKPDLTLTLGSDTVPRDALQSTIDQQTRNDHEQRIFLRADGVVSYRELMNVMNLLRDAGYLKIALVGLEDTRQATGPAPVSAPQSGGPRSEDRLARSR